MSSLGIYFGPRMISLVEAQGKKVLKDVQIAQPTGAPADLEGKAAQDTKLIQLVALFKDELRKNKIAAREAMLCLSGKELIIRAFEMPALPRSELKSAINFEVKKYIPFKVEDMVSDFQVQYNKASRINLVLFVGIKKETLERYIALLSQLNIKISTIEYAAFSTLRFLKLAGLRDKGTTAIVSADMAGQDEANFTVLKDGFPLFSRDFILTSAQEEIAAVREAAAPGMALEKLKTEIRVSLDYYGRKFSESRIQQLYFICNQDNRPEIEAFIREMNLPLQFVDTAKFFGRPAAFSLEAIKSYSASLARTIKSNLKIDILSRRVVKEKAVEGALQQQLAGLFSDLRVDSRAAVLAGMICSATFAFGLYRTISFQGGLDEVVKARPQLLAASSGSTVEELEALNIDYKVKLKTVNEVIKKQTYLTGVLDVIPRVLPKGMWLTNFSFNKDNDKAELAIAGRVYTGSSDKDLNLINRFIADLRRDKSFNNIFREINIASVAQGKEVDATVTDFTISCLSQR